MSGYFLIKIFFCFIQHVRNKGLDNGACQCLQTKATVRDRANKARLTCENIHAFRAKTHAYRVKNPHNSVQTRLMCKGLFSVSDRSKENS